MSFPDSLGNSWSILFDSADVMTTFLRALVATIAHVACFSDTPSSKNIKGQLPSHIRTIYIYSFLLLYFAVSYALMPIMILVITRYIYIHSLISIRPTSQCVCHIYCRWWGYRKRAISRLSCWCAVPCVGTRTGGHGLWCGIHSWCCV